MKCLHAHYAYRLAGGDDPVGRLGGGRSDPCRGARRGGPVRAAAIDIGTNSTRLLVAEVERPDGRCAPSTGA